VPSVPANADFAALLPWLVFSTLALMLVAPLGILVVQMLRPGSAWGWRAAVGSAFLAWGLVIALRFLIGNEAGTLAIPLQAWTITPDFSFTTMLLIDHFSWPFGAALLTLVLAVLLTAVMRPSPFSGQTWSGSLWLGGLALVAIWAGNPITLLLAWVALDILEGLILHYQVLQSKVREGISAALAARFSGVAVLILAILTTRSQGLSLTFENIPESVNPYLLLAAGLRLGVLPLQMPFLSEPRLRRGVGTVLRLAPAISSLTLLVRTAQVPAPERLLLPLLAFSGLSALYSGIAWLTAEDELAGRAFWILGMAALSVGSAVRGDPAGSLAWGLAMLYAGAQLFLYSERFRWLDRLMFLGVIGCSGLPFTPSWAGTRLLVSGSGPGAIPLILIDVMLFFGHVLLILGYVRHFWRAVPPQQGFDPWSRLVYPAGLLFLPASHWIFFFWGEIPAWQTAPLAMWWTPFAATGLVGVAWYLNRGDPLLLPQETGFRGGLSWGASFWGRVLSLDWLYRALFFLYRQVGRALSSMARLLEGDGGLLWALLLLLFLFSLSFAITGGV
jgi:hypothetical protein